MLDEWETLAAHWRADMAEVLAYVPAVRRSAQHAGADLACIDAMAAAAARSARNAENLSALGQLVHPPAPRSFCAAAVTTAFCNGVAALCPRAQLTCVAPQGLYTAGNARLFAVCVGNLVCNSLLYAAEQPCLTVQLRKRADCAVLSVHDAGKGMRPAVQQNAFTAWYAADPYADDVPAPGLGLGLAVVQQYAAAYGGTVWVHSRFGEECTVALSLPCTRPIDEEPAAAPEFLRDRCSTLYTQLAPVIPPPQ